MHYKTVLPTILYSTDRDFHVMWHVLSADPLEWVHLWLHLPESLCLLIYHALCSQSTGLSYSGLQAEQCLPLWEIIMQ